MVLSNYLNTAVAHDIGEDASGDGMELMTAFHTATEHADGTIPW